MRRQLTYVFLTAVNLLFCVSSVYAQQEEEAVKVSDTVRLNNSYGLRVGLDLQNIVTSITSSNFQGIEFMADYRLTDKYYLAGEFGNQKKTVNETSVSTTTDGYYAKVGIDTNVYKNLIGLRNMIFVGLRYGFATYSQDLNSFSVATQNNFFGVDFRDSDLKSEGLSAHWLEVIAGIKAEVFKNVYIGFSIAIQRKLSDEAPDGFDSLYIPGFGTTNDFGEISANYRYFISYYIPLYKRNKKVKVVTEDEEEKLPKE